MLIETVIPEYNLEWLQEKIDKLNKKAIKLNCDLITLTVTGEEIEKKENGEVNVFKYITIEGETPKLNDYQFIGKLEYISELNQNLILAVPNHEIPEYFRTIKPHCDHCHINRARKYTYLVQNIITNEISQVGSSCLKDFLGHANPEMYAGWAEMLCNLKEEINEAPRKGSGEIRNIEIEEYLAYVAENIAQHGWISAQDARYECVSSTANSAINDMFPPLRYPKGKLSKENIEFSQEALKWIREEYIPNGNQYMGNLKILCSLEYVKYSDLGFVASLITTYRKHLEMEIKNWQKELKEKMVNEYIGEIGKRITFDATLLYKQYIDNQYGSTLLRFITNEGHTVIWFASGYKGEDEFSQGSKYQITATIKNHQEYKEYKQTIVTRAKTTAL